MPTSWFLNTIFQLKKPKHLKGLVGSSIAAGIFKMCQKVRKNSKEDRGMLKGHKCYLRELLMAHIGQLNNKINNYRIVL